MNEEMSERSPVSTLNRTENTVLCRYRIKGEKDVVSFAFEEPMGERMMNVLRTDCDFHVFEGTFIPRK